MTREAEASAGGDQDALLHNMTATLGLICALLCIASASGMAAHNTAIMAQTMLFQAFVAPGLVFCGGLLYGSGVVIATGMSHDRPVLDDGTFGAGTLCREHRIVFVTHTCNITTRDGVIGICPKGFPHVRLSASCSFVCQLQSGIVSFSQNLRINSARFQGE